MSNGFNKESPSLQGGEDVKASDNLRQLALDAGWSLSNLAWRWGVSLEHLSRLFSDPDRPAYWADAVAGLPRLTRQDAARIRGERLAATAQVRARRARTRKQAAGQELAAINPYRGYLVAGSVLVVTRALGYAEIGVEGVVLALRETSGREEYLIRFPGGEEWFDAVHIEAHLAETGREVLILDK